MSRDILFTFCRILLVSSLNFHLENKNNNYILKIKNTNKHNDTLIPKKNPSSMKVNIITHI